MNTEKWRQEYILAVPRSSLSFFHFRLAIEVQIFNSVFQNDSFTVTTTARPTTAMSTTEHPTTVHPTTTEPGEHYTQ